LCAPSISSSGMPDRCEGRQQHRRPSVVLGGGNDIGQGAAAKAGGLN
jgi:hypothetical protein